MKNVYFLLVAVIFFAVNVNAQDGPTIVGSHDLMLLPVFGTSGIDAGPNYLFTVGFNEENQIIEEETDFWIWFALRDDPSSDNEIPETPFFNFISNSFNPGPGASGFGFPQTIEFDMTVAIPLNEAETDHAMLLKSYPNATIFDEGTPQESRDEGHVGDYVMSADSIYRLIDLDIFEDPSSTEEDYMVLKENFEFGKTYGLFYSILGCATISNGEINTIYADTDLSNNMVILPLTWNETNSVKDMAKDGASQKLVVFPNPVQNQFHFDHIFASKTEHVQINIVDITGKVVHTQQEATPTQSGARYTVDGSKLTAGTYIVQLITDHYTATSKFIKK